MGDVDEGDAAARADGGGGLGLDVGPLAQDGAQGRHERGAAVELAGAAGHDVAAAPHRAVQDRVQVLGPLLQAAAGHEVVGAGAHEEQVGAVDLGQEAVAHAAHGGPEPGVGGPFDVAPGAGRDPAGHAGHEGLVLGVDPRAGHERVADGGQAQRLPGLARAAGPGGRGRPGGRDDAAALAGRLGGQVHGAPGDEGLGEGDGTAQAPSDAGGGTIGGVHGRRF